MLLLESEFPMADWTTPSQVSTLEPLLGILLGSPWCPLNHISLNFPIWGSCAWFMNQRIHVFSMKIDWFQVVSGALMAWAWLLLVLDWMGGEERSDSWLKLPNFLSHQFQIYVTWEMMRFQLVEEGFNPWGTCVLFWYDWTSWDLMGRALVVCAEIWLVTSRKLSASGFCVWAGLVQLCFVVELLWAWLSLQNEEFCHRRYSWDFVVNWLWKNRHSSHKFCERDIFWEMSNLYFP